MYGYSYQTFQQKMLEEERDDYKRGLKRKLMKHEAELDRLKPYRDQLSQLLQKTREEIEWRAKDCVKIKELMNRPEGNLGA